MSTYAFDQAWQKERDRLTALEALYDGASRRLLDGLGITAGWRCLEVGCGAGGIALWLADRVGETGHVLATDLDTRFLDGHGRPNLEVRTHDIVTDPLDEAAFDVIHARAVVEHVADRELVIKRLAAALRPGGWMLIEEVDFGGATAGMLAEYVSAPEPERPAMGRIYLAVANVFSAIGADPSYGRRLVGALGDAGLARVAQRSCMRRSCPEATSSGRGAASSSSPSGSLPRAKRPQKTSSGSLPPVRRLASATFRH